MKKKNANINSQSESGQSLVELAISLIVLLFLLLGAVEFGIALFQYVSIRDAAQEGALYGSINPTDDAGMEARAIAAAADVTPLTGDNITVSWSNAATGKCEGSTIVGGVPVTNTLTVAISFDHEIFLPLVGDMIGTDAITMNAEVTDTILSPVCD